MRITSGQAHQMMFDMLEKESMGDRVYEFAQDLFYRNVEWIEVHHEIADKNEYGGGEEWYDEVREEFFQAVYDLLTKFLKDGE